MAMIAPSVLAADFKSIAAEISRTVDCGIDLLHMDIMDGHFVPNISFGPKFVKAVYGLTNVPLDVHLMLTNPEKYFDDFIEAGASTIIFHIEVHPDPLDHLKSLHSKNIGAGLSLNPDHDISSVLPYLEYCDRLLVMSVRPGFSGQEFMPETLETVKSARESIDRHKTNTLIAIDGGINKDNAKHAVDAGADILVMGSAFYRSEDPQALVNLVHSLPDRSGL